MLKEAGTKALQYTTTEGYVPLREWISKRMNERLGTSFDKDNILITHGSQQGLDLSGKVFLDEGDIVLCESPTYLAAISAFKAYGCSFIEIPTDAYGMNMDVLEDVLRKTKNIKLIRISMIISLSAKIQLLIKKKLGDMVNMMRYNKFDESLNEDLRKKIIDEYISEKTTKITIRRSTRR